MDIKEIFNDTEGPEGFIKASFRVEGTAAIMIFVMSVVLAAIFRSNLFLIVGIATIILQFLIKRWVSQILAGGIMIVYGGTLF